MLTNPLYSPFIPDADEPTAASDSNEPYLVYYEYLLSKDISEIPQVISNSYGDDEQVREIRKRPQELFFNR